MLAAAQREDVVGFCAALLERHTHMLPLAPYRTSNRRRVAGLKGSIASALADVGAAIGNGEQSSLGTTQKPSEFALLCLHHMSSHREFNTTANQFGSIGSCLLDGMLQCWAQMNPEASMSSCCDIQKFARPLISEWMAACSVHAVVVGPLVRCIGFGTGSCAPLDVAVVAAYAAAQSKEDVGIGGTGTVADLLLSHPGAVALVTPAACARVVTHLLAKRQLDHVASFMDLCLTHGRADSAGAVATAMIESRQFEALRRIATSLPTLRAEQPAIAVAIAEHDIERHLRERRYDLAIDCVRTCGSDPVLREYRRQLAVFTVKTVGATNPLLAHTLGATLGLEATELDRVCPVQATAGSSEQAHARFVPLALSGDHVHLVDSLDAVTAMAVSLQPAVDGAAAKGGPAVHVGVDAEWRPVFGATHNTPRPALLQLAVASDAFLIDTATLLPPGGDTEAQLSATAQELNRVLAWLFDSAGVIVVGYAVHTDLSHLAASFPGMTCFRHVSVRSTCLHCFTARTLTMVSWTTACAGLAACGSQWRVFCHKYG